MLSFPCMLMRGGSSKGLFFVESDLPSDPELRDRICVRAFGGPDPHGKQINGAGGTIANMNKLAIISRREGEPNTVNYAFGQVDIFSWDIGRKATCGNISSAVGPFAVERGLVDVIEEPITTVRIYDVNTGKYIVSHVPVKDGKVVYEGDFAIAGVPGTGAKIRLDFMEPGGPTTGKLLPTGNVIDYLETKDFEKVRVSIVDAANPFVFANLADVGLLGTEIARDINASGDKIEKMRQIRDAACVRLGWAKTPEQARKDCPLVPKVICVAPPRDFTSNIGETFTANQFDFSARMLEYGTSADIIALTGCVGLGVAAKIEGSIVNEVLSEEARSRNDLTLAYSGGLVPVGVEMEKINGQFHAVRGTVYRTARKMLDGQVSVIL